MRQHTSTKGLWGVIGASSVGTMIEWYDFYIFGSLATLLSTKFFPQDNPTAAFLATLATFAAGFVVRPFGALFFGRLGDLIGRKYTFMVTLLLMGGATFAIGCIPSYDTIGFMAPVLVLLLRLLQGLALGGEYGGAATYVAEHAPENERGYWTSWIQTTATVGLFISLVVIMMTRVSLSPAEFDAWGWRIPFLVSVLMVGVSYVMRRNMHESPLFAKVKTEGKVSKNPLKESFGNKLNFKFVLLALFGVVMGQGVVWYTGQFYAMSFIEKVCNVDKMQSDSLMTAALFLGTPFFVFFGWLSDKVGRKWIMMGGMLIAVVSYRPIYRAMFNQVNLNAKTEIAAQTTIVAELQKDSSKPEMQDSIYTTHKVYTDGTQLKEVKKIKLDADGKVKLLDDKGEKIKPDIKKTVTIIDSDRWWLAFFVWLQVIFVTMTYGPVAAFLVELFPVKIRYTSMSLPYHIGNGIFGGLLPAVATYLVTNAKKANELAEAAGKTVMPYTEPHLQGLWYPMIVAGFCFVIGTVYISNMKPTHQD